MRAHNETPPIGLATLRDLVSAADSRNPGWRNLYEGAHIEWAVQAAWIMAGVPPLAAIDSTDLGDIEGLAGRLLLAGSAWREVAR